MSILRLTVAIVAVALFTPAINTVAAASHHGRHDPAAKYRIDTTKLPGLDKELVALPQWSGNMPVGNNNSLFFWHTQAKNPHSNNLIFWHNGGPGCSSMEGLFEENGPYQSEDMGRTWNMNPYSWHHFGHMVYIDQPFGTGLSRDNTTVPNEDFIGDTMVEFYLHFFEAFPEMRSKNMYITGESYAGRYVPYMAKHVLDYNDKHKENAINLRAIALGDAYIDTAVRNSFIEAIPFLKEHPWLYGKNQTWMAGLERLLEQAKAAPDCYDAKSDTEIGPACAAVLKELGTYPSSTPVDFPLSINCTYQGQPLYYDPYNIATKDCQEAMSDNSYTGSQASYFLNIPVVQKEIHATPGVYAECDGNNATGGIYSRDPSVVPKFFIGDLIDRGLKVTLYTGLLDSVVPHTVTEAALREMTWKGHKGFLHSKMTEATMTPFATGHPAKQAGRYHAERGMSYVVFNEAGHMVPRDVPVPAYWMMDKVVIQKS